ncbi:MAG: DUF1573 domain-containing protein [Anaerolineales bacterium]|nr:DUF1573 domain-containing protein [Anaerolineales bacterium]
MQKVRRRRIKHGKARSRPWPLFLVLGGVLLIAITLLFTFRKPASSYTAEVKGGPHLKADKELVDLGDVKLGTPVKVSFQLTNVGDRTLRFKEPPYVEVKEGC